MGLVLPPHDLFARRPWCMLMFPGGFMQMFLIWKLPKHCCWSKVSMVVIWCEEATKQREHIHCQSGKESFCTVSSHCHFLTLMRPTYFTPESDRLGSFGTPTILCLNNHNSTVQSRCNMSYAPSIYNKTCICTSNVFVTTSLIIQNNSLTSRQGPVRVLTTLAFCLISAFFCLPR